MASGPHELVFRNLILERFEPDFYPFHPAFRTLFNSYYNGVGSLATACRSAAC